MAAPLDDRRRQAYIKARAAGVHVKGAAAEAGISRSVAYRIEHELGIIPGLGSTARRKELVPEDISSATVTPLDELAPRRRKVRRARVEAPAGGWDSYRSVALAEGTDEGDGDLPPPVHPSALNGAPRLALEDFGAFRRRYLGRTASPWQEDAARRMLGLLSTGEKEYVVLNAPPGPGKSTLFTHDLICWVICRNRAIRVMVGSKTEAMASRYVGRVKRTLERRVVWSPPEGMVRLGLAAAAQRTLIEDYGRFKPISRERWTRGSITVAGWDDLIAEDKEPTVSAFGFDTFFMGGRYDLVVWDDLMDQRSFRSAEGRDLIISAYEDEAESRLDPGGLMILQGQRLAPNDIYRHCLDQVVPVFEEGAAEVAADAAEAEDGIGGWRRKYHHIVYPAHHEPSCRGEHGRNAPPWRPPTEVDVAAALLGAPPARWASGCLLDPRRLSWRELVAHQHQNPLKYRILYQQEDVDPAGVLVPQAWLEGGVDPISKESHPGCFDDARGRGEIPLELLDPDTAAAHGPVYSVITTDPSPSRYWAVQWWLYAPRTQHQWLVDLVRSPLTAPDILDWDHAHQTWTGLIEEWHQRSGDLGRPVTTWIVEANVSQRFLLQQELVKRWSRIRSCSIVPHTTHLSKIDQEKGFEILKAHYRFGRVRLPWSPERGGRAVSGPLVDEVTRWPAASTDDQICGHWFLLLCAPRLFFDRAQGTVTRLRRPSWLARPDASAGSWLEVARGS